MNSLARAIAELRVAPPAAGPGDAAHAPTGAVPWHETLRGEWLIGAPADFAGQRAWMLAAIRERMAPLADKLGADAIARALGAMGAVPRERFVCPWVAPLAYLPMGLDIGLDQIISHPELVAVMAAAVASGGGYRGGQGGGHWLDVGTGSGYQAAVLAGMAQRVTSIEILEGHARLARWRLETLGYRNVTVVTGDGGAGGCFAAESFDGIVVAAGARAIPPDLWAALKVGGRLVMPLGESSAEEQLVVSEKRPGGAFRQIVLQPARFVPLTGQAAR